MQEGPGTAIEFSAGVGVQANQAGLVIKLER